MAKSTIILVLIFVHYFSVIVHAQQFKADISNHCIYTQGAFSGIPFILENDPQIEKIVYKICALSDLPVDFEVMAASISSIATVKSGNRYYLLYNTNYTDSLLSQNPSLLYVILSHEVGHIARKHKLDGRFRLSEESSADEFMGRILYKLGGVHNINAILSPKMEFFAYDFLYTESNRKKYILRGWNSEESLTKMEILGHLGYYQIKDNLDDLSFPVFEIKGCPLFYDLKNNYFKNCQNLDQVNQLLCQALDQMGYDQRRYYAMPGGFALLTPMEQINKMGISFGENERWQDYPSVNNIDGILEYLKSLIFPKFGYFRLFAFIITDYPVKNQEGNLNMIDPKDWLTNGGFWLPEYIGAKPFNKKYHVGVFVYEFEIPQTTKKLAEKCSSNLLSAKEHLLKSGLLQFIK